MDDLAEDSRILDHLVQLEIEKLDGKVITCAKFDEKYLKNVGNRLEEDFPEHIIGCKVLKKEKKIVTVTSRNTLTVRKSSNLKAESRIQCDYFATSICSLITGTSLENCHVYFGSVIGDLIDWRPRNEEKPIKRVGHKGMIFSIVTDSTRIFTISDDRTIRMWSIFDRKSGPISTVFGHTARPFSICLDPAHNLIYTGGIEQTLFCWKYTDSDIKFLRKTPISIGVIRKISKIDDSTLAISSQNGDLLKIHVESESGTTDGEETQILTEGIVNFAHLNGNMVVLNEKNELIMFESDSMEKIIFRCAEMKHMTSSDESVVTWQRNSLIFITNSNIYRLKLSLTIISATCHRNYAIVKTIDGFLQVYFFEDAKNIRCLKKFRPENSSVIPSVFSVIDNLLILGTTHGELYHSDLSENSEKIHQSIGRKQNFEIFSGKEVTCIRPIPEISAFMTLGKTGIWSTFRIIRKSDEVDVELLNSRSFSTSSQMAWPSKFLKFNEDLLIVGFYGTSLIIWNSTKGVPVVEIYCGGGHRIWQLSESTTESILNFDFIRDSQLCRRKVDLVAKNYLISTPHSSPIVAASGSLNYLATVSLDGHLSIGNSQGKSIITTFIGENLLCTDLLENEEEVFVMAGGGKSKLAILRFLPSDLHNHNVFWLRHVQRPDEGRIVDVKICRTAETQVILVASYSSGVIETFRIGENSEIESVDVVEIEDSLGIASRIDFDGGNLFVGTTGSYFLCYALSGTGKLEETRRTKLTDRSGVTSLAVSSSDDSIVIGCDSGNVFRISRCHVESPEVRVHSHLSTVVGIVVNNRKIHSTSLDCVILTSSEVNSEIEERKPTIVDMPNGMVKTGKSKLAVFGDTIQIIGSDY